MVRLATTQTASLVMLALLSAAWPAWAQPPEETPEEAPAGEGEESAPDEGEIAELRRELAAQREELERQSEELAAQRAALESTGEHVDEHEDEDAELAAILADVEADHDEEDTEEEPLRIYGFMDVGLQRTWGTSETEVTSASNESTFVLGNVNVYLDMQPVEDWRGLLEVRFTNLPHGFETALDTPVTTYTRTDTSIIDATSPPGFLVVRTGAVIMERAHIEWEADERLTLRAGLFLTPYGIWNVDHGTPTLISLTFPVFQIIDLWPRQQVGLEALGIFHALPWELGYHLWVGNGRTAALLDLTDDKAIGGRLFARTRRPFPMTYGVSAFYGRSEDNRKVLASLMGLDVQREFIWEAEELGLAADVSLDIGDLRLRTEAVYRQIFYEDGLRPPRFETGPAVLLGEAADRRELGVYVLAAYRTGWAGLEPYLFGDLTKWPTPLGDMVLISSVGLNVHFTEATMLKLQASHGRFFDVRDDHATDAIGGHVNFVAARLIMAF